MGGYVVAGYLVGTWLDGVFETTPWLTVLYLCLGLVAAGRSVWRVSRSWRRAIREQSEDQTMAPRPLMSGRWSEGVR